MTGQLCNNIVQKLWQDYRKTSLDIQRIEAGLSKRGIHSVALDHFAIIDLPGPHTGIPYLSRIFSAIGYTEHGKDYLADKQNDFLWMAASNSRELLATEAPPQVVVADFRLDAMPIEIRKIIEKYSSMSPPAPVELVRSLAQRAANNDSDAMIQCVSVFSHYLAGRDWELPTTHDFYTVREFNELLSWVLIFGRRPNHFTLSVHLLDQFAGLPEFHRFIEEDVQLTLNREGGTIKGGESAGIAQGSTTGMTQVIALADGKIEIPAGFVEFAWRYPSSEQPKLWGDYFTGFVAQHADRVIESLYTL